MALRTPMPVEVVDLQSGPTLDDYAGYAMLQPEVEKLRQAARLADLLAGRRVWMISSTREGGGVAESVPHLVRLLNGLRVACGWIVVKPSDGRFFALTKRLHNMIHGVDC